MKKIIFVLAGLLSVPGVFAFQKALYVKSGDTYTKYNFGVAGQLNFSNNGKTLTISGYNDVIDLDKVDYISLSAPVDGTALTPSAQKEKLVEIGEEVNSMVDINRHADLVKLFHAFFGHFEDANGNYHHPASEFTVPEEYYDVHKVMSRMMRGYQGVSDGNVASIRKVASSTPDLYKIEDYFGVYYANEATESWEKISSADYLEIQFTPFEGSRYYVRLVPSAEYTTWKTRDFEGQCPRVMNITFGQGDKVYATTVIKTELVQDSSIDMQVDFEANGYVVNNVMKVVNEKITNHVTAFIDGKKLVDATSDIQGKNLVDYDDMYDAFIEAGHHHDEEGNCLDGDGTALCAHFIRATSDVDIIGKLQVKAKATGFSKVYDVLSQDDYVYSYVEKDGVRTWSYGKVINQSNGTLTTASQDKALVDRKVKYLCDYSDATFHYDGTKTIQGYLSWENDERTYEDVPYYMYEPNYLNLEGYVIVDGILIYVRRDEIWGSDPVTNEWKVIGYSDWYYSGEIYNEENDYYDWVQVTVPESSIIHPELILEKRYELMPVLVFPDLTSFAFEDYFDEVSFKKLIDDYNDIIDTYNSITGQD